MSALDVMDAFLLNKANLCCSVASIGHICYGLLSKIAACLNVYFHNIDNKKVPIG